MSEDDIREYAELLIAAERLRAGIAEASDKLAHAQYLCAYTQGVLNQFGPNPDPIALNRMNEQLQHAMREFMGQSAVVNELSNELAECEAAIASF